MSIDKKWYVDRLKLKIAKCLELEEKLLSRELPKDVRINLGTEDLYAQAKKQGQVMFLGGRHLAPEQTISITIEDAALYTFVDGEIPSWINLHFEGYDEKYSYIRLYYCADLVDSEDKLRPMPDGSKQFRILLSEQHQLYMVSPEERFNGAD